MKKKWLVAALSIVCLGGAIWGTYGLQAFANEASVSTSVTGTFKALSPDNTEMTTTTDQGDKTIPLAKSVWVYRNEQKAQLADIKSGDTIEIIVNSKGQAAYVKAYAPGSQQAAADTSAEQAAGTMASTLPASNPQTGSHGTPAPTPNSSPAANPNANPGSTVPTVPAGSVVPTAPSTGNASGTIAGSKLSQLDVSVKNGRQFKLELKLSPDNNHAKDEFSITTDNGGTVHLKGDQAAKWINSLLAEAHVTENNAKQQLTQAIARQYSLDEKRLDVKFKAQWAKTATGVQSGRPAQRDDKDEDKKDKGAKTPPKQPAKPGKHDDQGKDEDKKRGSKDD